MTNPDCLFCKIVAGEIPATVVYRDDDTVAFRDINPQAPVHVLVVPTAHVPNAVAAAASAPTMLGAMVATAGRIADREGIADSGYRLIMNTGPDSGQTVFHVHLHLLGGRQLSLLG